MTKFYAGLDVSLEMTIVCVVDEDGHICLEAKVPCEPTALIEILSALDGAFVRVGLEAGPLSQWSSATTSAGTGTPSTARRADSRASISPGRKTGPPSAEGIARMPRMTASTRAGNAPASVRRPGSRATIR